MPKKLYFSFFLVFFNLLTFAQDKATVSGYVRDVATGESLPAANIYIPALNKGVKTNNYGFYSITIPVGSYEFKVSYLGFDSKIQMINATSDQKINFLLGNKRVVGKEIIITGKAKDKNVQSTEMGVHQLDVSDIKKLPVILGEVDILKSLQLLPGVSSAGEGQSGFYVRGGGPDQNLILLDDAVVYNTGHLFGFFSVFNADAIKNVTLIKGGMPANYGGRLSSVVDVTMKDGNNKEYQVDGGIGLIASRLSFQGPIVKDKSSFIVSARRTYIDALVKPFVSKESTFSGSGYYFYDVNAKANYTFSDKDRVYLSAYLGKDVFTFQNSASTFSFNVPWGNKTATLRWNHLFSDKLFLNTTAVYNDYNFEFNGAQQDFKVKLFSGIRDLGIKSDLDYYSSFGHNFKGGLNYTWHTFTPSTIVGESAGVEFNPNQADKKFAHEIAAYVMDEFDIGQHVKINAGLRYSQFLQAGPYTRYTFDPFNQTKKLDSTVYSPGEIAKSYGGLEPRLNARLTLNNNSSFKASVSRNYQYLHLVTNNGSTLPTDIWTPSTYFVQPQIGWQYSLGYFRNFKDNMFETSVEVYYKDMQNLLEYREGYTPDQIRDIDYEFVFGNGEAYGAEFYLNKAQGKFTGWISYTLAWTKRNFEKLNNGDPYFAKYDQRHNFSITGAYELNKKWTFSSLFVFGSGTRVTLPSDLYIVDQTLLQGFDKLNNFVLPAYHRLDIGAIYTPQPKKERRWTGSWAFGIYNVYSRLNPYFIYLDLPGDLSNGVDLKVKQVSIFPIIPSVTYNFKFK